MTCKIIPFIRKDSDVTEVVKVNQALSKTVNNTPQNSVNMKAIESVLMKGDLTPLTVEQRIEFYKSLCESLHLNWMTKPFDYIVLNGKLTLYAKKDCTEQLRRTFKVSIRKLEKEIIDGICIFTASAEMPDGRTDQSSGVVSIAGLKGEHLSNAVMKAETKAKRRVTLSICGLGFVDESEIDSIQGAKKVSEDYRPEEPKTKSFDETVLPDFTVSQAKSVKPIGSGVYCDLEGCGQEMTLSKAGLSYYCPNWNKGGDHLRFPAIKLESFRTSKNA